MNAFEILLQPRNQTLNVRLGQQTIQLTIRWNPVSNVWMLDMNDQSGQPILLGIPLVTGVDLLEQHQHLGLGGQLLVQTDQETQAAPTLTNLGVTAQVYFVPKG